MKPRYVFAAATCLSVCGLAFAGDTASGDMMKRIDTNGDGSISLAEHEAHARAMFARMDTDNNGSVTAAEMEAGHRSMMGDKKMQHDKMAKDGKAADEGMVKKNPPVK